MDKILDMISKWEPLGQGIFFLIILGILLQIIAIIIKMPAIIKHGWPPPEPKSNTEDED